MERLKYAIAYGADAVYLAGKHFGMRAASSNFSDEELREGIAYAHARGVKIYVTVNISPRSNEFAELEEYQGEAGLTLVTCKNSGNDRQVFRCRQMAAG